MKQYFTFALLTLAVSSFAQTGSWYVGGAAGFSTSKTEFGSTTTDDSNSWQFSPEVGTWLTDNIQLGLGVTLGGFSSTDENNNESTNSVYGGTLYGRYFFNPGQAFRPFVGLNIPVLAGKQTIDFGTGESKSDINQFGVNLNAGFGYAIAPRWTVVGSLGVLGFNSTTFKPDGGGEETKTNDFDFLVNSLGNRFTIGFYYTFLQ
ncbi:MAG: outer membrane beta-barrel protein [Saprospiraceae bacterium]